MVEEAEEAKSDERTTGRKSSKGRSTDCRGSGMSKPKPTKREGDNRAKRGKAMEKKAKTWAEITKVQIEDELEIADSDKRGNELEIVNSDKSGKESETTDLLQQLDSEELVS